MFWTVWQNGFGMTNNNEANHTKAGSCMESMRPLPATHTHTHTHRHAQVADGDLANDDMRSWRSTGSPPPRLDQALKRCIENMQTQTQTQNSLLSPSPLPPS